VLHLDKFPYKIIPIPFYSVITALEFSLRVFITYENICHKKYAYSQYSLKMNGRINFIISTEVPGPFLVWTKEDTMLERRMWLESGFIGFSKVLCYEQAVSETQTHCFHIARIY
jgi:hypothetical protein